jgi:hypothetical protein
MEATLESNNDELWDRVCDLVERIKYDRNGWKILVIGHAGTVMIQVYFEAPPDRITGLVKGHYGRRWLITRPMLDSEIVQTAFMAVKAAEEHECRERFLFDHKRIFSPHFDAAQVAALMESGELKETFRK